MSTTSSQWPNKCVQRDLWDSLSENPADLSLTQAQRAELDRRLNRLESGKAKLVSWEELKARLVG